MHKDCGLGWRWPVTYAALLAATLAAPTAAQSAADAESLDAASGPRRCLPHPSIKRTKILNDNSIVFVTRDDTIYNSTLPKECPSLKRDSLVHYGITNGRICAGDRFQILLEMSPRNYVPTFMCELGSFVPITADELEDLLVMTDENRERRRGGRSSREAIKTQPVELPPETGSPSSTAAPATPTESGAAETAPAE
jgi:hypothetical protein